MAAAATRPQIGSVGEFNPKKEDFYTYDEAEDMDVSK